MNRQIHDEAADFFVELRTDGDTPARRTQFDAWLRRSPEHIKAYLQVVSGWEDARHVAAPGIDELVALARSDTNVHQFRVPLSRAERAVDAIRQRSPGRVAIAVAAAVVLVTLAVALYALAGGFLGTLYSTKAGERLTLQLSDGSTISLNTLSKVRVRFSTTSRAVELIDGQALFKVAKDATRPFTVSTDVTQVRALGTAFDVRRSNAKTIVTVVEGTVAVSEERPFWKAPIGTAPASGAAVVLTANQQTVATPSSIDKPRSANAVDATAWTQGRLVFDAVALREVIAEFNRYGTHRLVLDPKFDRLSITAAFDSADPTSLVNFLRTLPDLEIREGEDTTLIVPSR